MPEAGEKISRREMLTGLWAKCNLVPVIDKEQCTGCGLCALNCPEQALKVGQDEDNDRYQIVFTDNLCTGCGHCATVCPEQCLKLHKGPEDGLQEGQIIVFADEMTRCAECGVPLFPLAMVKKLRERTSLAGETDIPFDLCPACRMARQIARGMLH